MKKFILLLIIPFLSFSQKKSVDDYKNWTLIEKKSFIQECIKEALQNNPNNASKTQIKNYCECCLIKSMDKYESPQDLTRDFDMKWFEKVSYNCRANMKK